MRNETAKHSSHVTPALDRLVDPPPDRALPAPVVSLLALQFLAWVAAAPRTHADVMDAWRSTCPRQSVWEDMLVEGLVAFEAGSRRVALTALGRAALAASSSYN